MYVRERERLPAKATTSARTFQRFAGVRARARAALLIKARTSANIFAGSHTDNTRTRLCFARSNKVTSSILQRARFAILLYRAVTQISRRYPAADSCVSTIGLHAQKERKSETLCGTKHHVSVLTSVPVKIVPRAPRETQTPTNFFFPSLPLLSFSHLHPSSSFFPIPLPNISSSSSRRAGFKTKMYVPIRWPLFVRDCETRFLRKRREKLQSRFVERFD